MDRFLTWAALPALPALAALAALVALAALAACYSLLCIHYLNRKPFDMWPKCP